MLKQIVSDVWSEIVRQWWGATRVAAGLGWRGWWLALAVLLSSALPGRALAAHAYAQFGDIAYPPGFDHFAYVNPQAPKKGELSLVSPTLANNFDKYNPFTLKGTEPPGLTALVFETLLVGNMQEPATSYGLLADDIDVAPDRLSATFHLNPKARFHNGDPVLAKDVKHSFDMLTSKQAAPQYPLYFSGVKRVTIVNERTVRFDFARPDAELPLIAGSLPVFSHKWGQVDGKPKPFDQIVTDTPIASGPYRMASAVIGKDVTYQRDPNYWARELNTRKGQFNFDRIIYRMYNDNVAQFEAFKAGEFDFIESYISKDWVRQYKGGKFDTGDLVKRTLVHRRPARFQGFIFNTRLDKFKDPRVREAIDLAMDFEWMSRQLFYGIYKRIDSYFANSDYEAKDLPQGDELALLAPLRAKLRPEVFTQPVPRPPVTTPPHSLRDNLRRARDLLAQAGWTMKDGALRNAKGEPFTIEFLDNSPSFGRVMAPYFRNLEKLGIHPEYRVVDYAVYEKRMRRFEFEVESISFERSIIPGSELLQAYHSSQANQEGSSNYIGISDPAIDALLEKIQVAKTKPELTVAVRALDRVLRHGHYAVLHWYSNNFRVAYRNHRFGMLEPPAIYTADTWAVNCWWSL